MKRGQERTGKMKMKRGQERKVEKRKEKKGRVKKR